MWGFLELREHAGENFQPQVFLVAQAVGAPLDDADLVVEPLHESERDLVLWLAISGDPIPMTIDDFGELLVGRKPLPLQARPPVVEEAARPAFDFVVPELPKDSFIRWALLSRLLAASSFLSA